MPSLPELTPTETPKPCNRTCPVASTFLTLPPEIRLQIYSLLLINGSDLVQEGDENTGQERFMLPTKIGEFIVEGPGYGIDPTILQTCRQIYREANPVLYSQNVFVSDDPENVVRFFEQIGPVNLKLIRKLKIWVPSEAKLSPWVGLLYLLSEGAHGLRSIGICWGANPYNAVGVPQQTWELGRGLGDNLLFVNALGRIRGLEELVIGGFYAKNWLAYLEDRMGARVQAGFGMHYDKRDMKDKNLSDDMRVLIEAHLQMVATYQQGTEKLIP